MRSLLFLLTVGASLTCAGVSSAKVKAGDAFPPLQLKNIHGADVSIPDPETKWVHLQFRRFAGCPICNIHLQTFVRRNSQVAAAGIHEVVIFHSPDESLLPYQGSFPFDVVGDPDKLLYHQFDVETSVFALLNPLAWPAIARGIMSKDKPEGRPEGGPLGLPADFLIAADGKVIASHYGRHAYDQWSVEELLKLVK